MKKLLVVAVAVGFMVSIAGCGTSNQALKTEWPYRIVTQDDADDTVTIARLATDATVTTEYNFRYWLTVTAPAGEYTLKAIDSSGGRYFAPRGRASVTLTYTTSVSLRGNAEPDAYDGGIHVDSQGTVSLYWLWNSDSVNAARAPLPNVTVSISAEIDQERLRARLEREQREYMALAKRLEAEEAKRKAEQAKRDLLAALALARSRDRVECAGAQCDRAFAQAQAYLLMQADMRIQVATPTLIETYNATADGQLQMRLLRVPTTGDRWEIVLTAHCRDERMTSEERCNRKLLEAYGGFLPHMQMVK